jgi:hypothetical protein
MLHAPPVDLSASSTGSWFFTILCIADLLPAFQALDRDNSPPAPTMAVCGSLRPNAESIA